MKAGGRYTFVVALVVFVLLASACGARVSEEQRAAALGGGTPAGPASGGAVGGESAAVDGADDATTGGEVAPAQEAGDAPITSAGGSSTATTLAAGGNGGATDVGVTGTTISMGTVTTLSGPIPGLFQGASIGAQAFAAHLNSQGGVFGRQLKVVVRDDQFDAGQYRSQAQDLSKQVLGFLGSFSTFDDAAQADIEKAGIPDVGYGLTDVRRNSPMNFSPHPAKSNTFRTGGFLYYGKRFPEAVKAVATLYGDVPASKGGGLDAKAAAESVGWRFIYERAYQPTETDFTADVVRMRQAGVKGVYIVASDSKTMARFSKSMQQQGFKPEFVAFGASGYDPALLTIGGAAVEGAFVDQQLALYQGTDAGSVPEVALLNQWVQKVKPGYVPDLFAAYAWASGRLLEQALKSAGPNLTRKSLLAALQKVDKFDANGLIAESGPASKRQALCNLFLQVKGGKFTRIDPVGKGFICEGTIYTRR